MGNSTLRRLIVGAALLCSATSVGAGETISLPRKLAPMGNRDETYPGIVVRYAAIRDSAGHRLRLIATYPQAEHTRYPTIFVVGWLSCDTVEAPPGTTDATQRVLRAMATLPGFASVRLEKAGVGDSEGDCAKTDFAAELAAYQQAFRTLKNYPFVDANRIFILGISNGGGWIKTWYEHMLEIERRRLTLGGYTPAEVNTLMKRVAALYSGYLLDRQPPREIFQKRPDLRSLSAGDPNQLYGRPVTYYQQLQDLNLMAAWSAVAVPVLALHGEFDWIMSRSDIDSDCCRHVRSAHRTLATLAAPARQGSTGLRRTHGYLLQG